MPVSVEHLQARSEIHDLLMRYCRAVDRLDEELLRSCYHADAVDDHGHWKGSGHDFATFIVGSLAARAHRTTHAVANVLIELDDAEGDRAHVESYALASLRRTDDSGDEWLDQFYGRYLDVVTRRDGVWRIASRVVVHDWSISTRLDPGSSFPLAMDGFLQGRRDRTDPVYGRP